MAISTETSKPNGLAEVAEVSVCKHERMAQLLVHYVGFWRVHRLSVVPDLLRAVEHAEGESVQELALGEQARDWPQPEIRLLLEKFIDVIHLRNNVL